MVRQRRSEQGFTLIEVIVAATILFAAIGTGMLSYQTAMHSSQRAGQLLELLKVTDTAQQHIQKAIRDAVAEGQNGPLNGRTQLFNVYIDWQAEPSIMGSPPTRFDPDQLEEVEYATRFYQYQVALTMRNDQVERNFIYLELAWHDDLQTR